MNTTEQDREYLKTLTILYVEDDDVARGLLARSLGLRCSSLIEARNGVEGLESYKTYKPDIVVSDIRMPVMDGLGMAQEIRACDKNIPIIVTTAFEQTDYFQRSISIGINKYVLKPIMLDLLNSALLDCARQLRLEEQQQKYAEHVHQAEKNEAIGQLAGGVAHHFNNILQVIGGYSEMALMHISEGDPNHERLTKVIEAAQRAARINQGLLAFSRIQSIKRQHTDINDVVQSLEPLITLQLNPAIQLRVECTDSPLICDIDREQIELAVRNLVSNAINAMINGGVLSIETSFEAICDSFTFGSDCRAPGDYALISVSDTGTGMDRDVLHQIFNPFYTTQEIGQGTGLGLPMSLGIVRTHDGFINVDSEPGKGTSVRMHLPVIPSLQKRASAGAVRDAPPQGTETILVVDDSAEMLQFMSQMLEKYGYQVISADNCRSAMDKLSTGGADVALVVTDMFMQNMTGQELCSAIRLVQPEMKFLFTSGFSVEIIRQGGGLEERADFISKPFRPYDILKKIRDILDDRSDGTEQFHGKHHLAGASVVTGPESADGSAM
jgi:signal transduction histidine kinase